MRRWHVAQRPRACDPTNQGPRLLGVFAGRTRLESALSGKRITGGTARHRPRDQRCFKRYINMDMMLFECLGLGLRPYALRLQALGLDSVVAPQRVGVLSMHGAHTASHQHEKDTKACTYVGRRSGKGHTRPTGTQQQHHRRRHNATANVPMPQQACAEAGSGEYGRWHKGGGLRVDNVWGHPAQGRGF